MKAKHILFISILLLSALAFVSCDKPNNCNNIDCFTPPQSFVFNLVDADSNINVFALGLYMSENISAIDEDGKSCKFEIMEHADTTFLMFREIGWTMGEMNYSIILNDSTQINFVLNMKEVNENCCTFFETLKFEVLNYPSTIIDSTDVIQIEI